MSWGPLRRLRRTMLGPSRERGAADPMLLRSGIVVDVDMAAVVAAVCGGDFARHASATRRLGAGCRQRHAHPVSERPAIGVEAVAFVEVFAHLAGCAGLGAAGGCRRR